MDIIQEIIECATEEIQKIDAGKSSKWSIVQLESIVIPEMSELLEFANGGEVLLKYGRKQRLLESTYTMTDSIQNLDNTQLGIKISKLQKVYNSI